MLTEVVVKLEDRPGTLATLGELLGGRGVDIRAVAVLAVPGGGALAHLVVEPADVAVRALREAGMPPERVREVLVVTLEDEPGALGRYCRRLADAGINLEAVYLAGEKNGSKQLVLAVSDLDTARRL
ncbi:MAG TPA: amino acid-binding protein [Actinomycetes bacterium]|nr:amino acid-binding protein [Actinomycetes bacterium]